MEHILLFVILVLWGLLDAWRESQIEGKDGWAAKLPTWKYKIEGGRLWYKPFGAQDYQVPSCGKWKQLYYVWFIKHLLDGKEYTAYHRAVDGEQFLVAHLAVSLAYSIHLLFLHATPTISWPSLPILLGILEIRALSFVMVSWAVEDTLYFVLNPCYGLKKYKPEFIEWHAANWWIFAPKAIIKLIVFGCGIYLVSCVLMWLLMH